MRYVAFPCYELLPPERATSPPERKPRSAPPAKVALGSGAGQASACQALSASSCWHPSLTGLRTGFEGSASSTQRTRDEQLSHPSEQPEYASRTAGQYPYL